MKKKNNDNSKYILKYILNIFIYKRAIYYIAIFIFQTIYSYKIVQIESLYS